MLKKQTDSVQSMTIQSIDSLNTKSAETMQSISEKSQNQQQQQTASKNGHISFSVASLLADTRPIKSTSPVSHQTLSPPHHSSDDEYDSNQEDSIVDVEDLNTDQKSDSLSKDSEHEHFLSQQRDRSDFHRDGMVNQGPIRPTPFSALAAAVYQAAHPNWAAQGLVGPFGGPGPMFQGPTPFGVPNINAGKLKCCSRTIIN